MAVFVLESCLLLYFTRGSFFGVFADGYLLSPAFRIYRQCGFDSFSISNNQINLIRISPAVRRYFYPRLFDCLIGQN